METSLLSELDDGLKRHNSAEGFPDPLSEQDAFHVEQVRCEEHAKDLRRWHPQDPTVRQCPIGLTFSGGGSRAAAFHCGVLWSLAHKGLMKDVTQLSSTSGGAYTACSLLTHLFQMSSEADQAPSLDDWYKQVVMRTTLRMQHNINWLVDWTPSRRFGRADSGKQEEAGSGFGWRIFDLPLLVMAISAVMLVSPVLLIVHTVWPVVLHIEMEHGHMLRNSWCTPVKSEQGELTHWFTARIWWLAACAITAVFLNFVAVAGPTAQQKNPTRYLILRSIRQLVQRGAILYLVYTFCVAAVVWTQTFEWGSAASSLPSENETDPAFIDSSPEELAWVRSMCYVYITERETSGPDCSDYNEDGRLWYNIGNSKLFYQNETWTQSHASADLSKMPRRGIPLSFDRVRLLALTNAVTSVSVSTVIVLGFIVLIVGSTLLKWVFTLAGPFIYLLIIVNVAKWKIYGPITGQWLLPVESTAYTEARGATLYYYSFALAIISLPIYDVWQKLAHWYYRRSLKLAFFFGGKDVSDASIATCPYCPNMLLGACLNDYRAPGQEENLVDFTISSFFVGSRRTGFFFTPGQARLAHLMTMAGAAPDATALKEMDTFLIRVVLAVFCLRFGDFLRLQPEGETAVRLCNRIGATAERMGARLPGKVMKKYTINHDLHWVARWVQGLIDRFPAALPVLACNVILLIGTLQNGNTDAQCQRWRGLQSLAFYLFLLVVVSSFFAFLRPLHWLMRSPMIQQFQMIVMHRYKAMEPPPYVYVCDGGLIEVLGLLPLLRRRMKCIVVSDAADDPNLTMRCLREASANVRKENLCSFFDPAHPNRDFEFCLRELSTSTKPYFKMGVLFEPSETSTESGTTAPEIGWVYYVRMRRRQDDMAPIRGLLTEEELMGPPQTVQSGLTPPTTCTWGKTKLRNDMSGTCFPWCECGGMCVGRIFPNFGVGNQCLSPIHFSNLCGLGAEQTEALVECLCEDRVARAT